MDLRFTDIYLAEVYQFDRFSRSLKKFIIEKGTDFEIIKQFEYKRKDEETRRKISNDPFGEKQEKRVKETLLQKEIN